MLDFWASWCATCRASFPFLDELQTKHQSQRLRVVGLTLEEDKDAIIEFLDSIPVRFTIARDPSGRAGEEFEAAVATLLSGGTLAPGADVRVAESLKATHGVKAWQRTYLADPIMELNGDPLTRLLREHVHSSKEGAAGDGGPTGGGCGCN